MNRILRLAAVLAGAMLAFAMATATAFAGSYPITGAPWGTAPAPRIPLPCTPQCAVPAPIPAVTHTVVIGGMPGWQIVLIAAGAALVAATVAVLAERARAGRQRVTTTAA